MLKPRETFVIGNKQKTITQKKIQPMKIISWEKWVGSFAKFYIYMFCYKIWNLLELRGHEGLMRAFWDKQ